jgi:hypothetical protein
MSGRRILRAALLGPTLLLAFCSTARAAVLFESKGVKKDWDSFTSPDQVTEVTSPIYGTGPTGLRMLQKFTGFGSYHCEVRKHDGMKVGQDLYFGEAMQLPANWKFHDQNVTFQQYARSDVFGSAWALVFIQRDHLYAVFDGSGTGYNDLGSVANLQGTWIRLVIRIKLLASGGLFETWVNGTKTASLNINYDKGGPGVRWSVGMYCTYWRRENPAGIDPMILFHDQMRIATTLEEADPASWSGVTPPPPVPDAGTADGAATSPIDASTAVDSAPAAPADAAAATTPDLGAGTVRDAAPNRATARLDSASEDPEPEPVTPPAKKPTSGGCTLAVAPPSGFALFLALALLAVALRRRSAR